MLISPTIANTSQSNPLFNNVLESKLHQHPQWIALNHYYSNNEENEYHSEIDDPSFFLSKNGSQSPRDELLVSLKTLLSHSQNSKYEFICRYPARLQFFIEQLQLDTETFNSIHCSELNVWLKEHTSNSISLIYPTSYLNNPASVFGHTFLRFNREGYEKSLGFAVDFAAIVQPNDGLFSYIYKGMSGGYKGIYSIRPYYVKSWEYSDIENRKIWEYELNLNPQQVQFLLLHLWELRGKYIDYYFVDENCSYQILALINVAQPQLEFRQQFSASTIPADTVRYLLNSNMINQTEYIPPLELRYLNEINSLSERHQQIILSFSSQPDIAYKTHLESLKKNLELINIVTNYLYAQIQHRDISNEKGFEVITKLNHLRVDISEKSVKTTISGNPDTRIDKAHYSHRITLGAQHDTYNTSTILGYRPAYHDFSDPIDSFNPGSEINIMNTMLISDRKGLHIENIQFLSLSSLQTSTHFSNPFAWRFQLHRKRFYFNPDGDLVDQANFFIGKATNFYDFNMFALAQTGITYNSIVKSDISINTGYNLGSLLQKDGYTVLLQYHHEQINSIQNFRHKSYLINSSIKYSNSFSWNLSYLLTNTRTYKQRLFRTTLNYYF